MKEQFDLNDYLDGSEIENNNIVLPNELKKSYGTLFE